MRDDEGVTTSGWYADPCLPTRWRYFDGATWTGWVHPPEVHPPEVHPPAREGVDAQWWWAGGSLVAVFMVSLALAWLVNR
jgi:hypothetical protein